jgi:hypothetical protein
MASAFFIAHGFRETGPGRAVTLNSMARRLHKQDIRSLAVQPVDPPLLAVEDRCMGVVRRIRKTWFEKSWFEMTWFEKTWFEMA